MLKRWVVLTWVFVVVRIVANPFSNVFQKQLAERSARPIFIIGVVHACLALVCVPLLLILGTPVISIDVSWVR